MAGAYSRSNVPLCVCVREYGRVVLCVHQTHAWIQEEEEEINEDFLIDDNNNNNGDEIREEEKKNENHFGGKMPESVKAELCSSKNVSIVIREEEKNVEKKN